MFLYFSIIFVIQAFYTKPFSSFLKYLWFEKLQWHSHSGKLKDFQNELFFLWKYSNAALLCFLKNSFQNLFTTRNTFVIILEDKFSNKGKFDETMRKNDPLFIWSVSKLSSIFHRMSFWKDIHTVTEWNWFLYIFLKLEKLVSLFSIVVVMRSIRKSINRIHSVHEA